LQIGKLSAFSSVSCDNSLTTRKYMILCALLHQTARV